MSEVDRLLQTGMSMIASAGDGRTLVAQAVDSALELDFENADRYLTDAFEKIRTAHIAQTQEIQNRMADEEHPEEAARLLFTHAQDTLMTISSEYNLSKQLIAIIKLYDERLKKLEEKING